MFVGFFLLTGLAIAASHDRRARALGVALMLGLITFHGLSGRTTWPFFAWHLYGFRASTMLEVNQIRVGNLEEGHVVLDARAVPPALPSTIRRLANRMLRMEEPQRQEIGAFLIESASTYQSGLSRPTPILERLRFAAHQSRQAWEPGEVGAIESVEIHHIRADFDETGQTIQSQKTETLWNFP